MTLLKKHQEIEDEKFDEEFRAYINAGINFSELQENYKALDFEDEVDWLKSHIHTREERLLERVREEIEKNKVIHWKEVFPENRK